jgi:hypothetical protein
MDRKLKLLAESLAPRVREELKRESESYTTEELNEAFAAAGLDTEKYTTEYLAEQLGFEPLNEYRKTPEHIAHLASLKDTDPAAYTKALNRHRYGKDVITGEIIDQKMFDYRRGRDKARLAKKMVDDPNNPGSKISMRDRNLQRLKDYSEVMVDDPENPGEKIRRGSLLSRKYSRQLVGLEPNEEGQMVPVRYGASFYDPKVARVGAKIISPSQKPGQTFDQGLAKQSNQSTVEKGLKPALRLDNMLGSQEEPQRQPESYTDEEMNEAFTAAGLDTDKFTTEYLAEQLGFKRLK